MGTFQKKMNSSSEDCGEDRGIGLKEVTFFYILFFKIICSNVYLYYRSLEVKLPYDPRFLSIGWLVGLLVYLSYFPNKMAGRFTSMHPIRAHIIENMVANSL